MSEWEVYCDDGSMFLNKRPAWCAWRNKQTNKKSYVVQCPKTAPALIVSRFGLAVRRKAGKQKDLGSIPASGFPFSSNSFWFVYGHCVTATLLTANTEMVHSDRCSS